MFIIALLGAILLVGGIAYAVFKSFTDLKEWKDEWENWNYNRKRTHRDEDVPEEPKKPSVTSHIIRGTAILAFGIVLLFLNSAILETRDGFAYRIINPSGAKSAITTPGYHLVNPWARVQEWNKYIDIRTLKVKKDGSLAESPEGIEGVMKGGIPIRFTDQVTGHTYISVRVQLPEDEDSFLKVAEVFRHPENLTNNTLIPTIREQIINTSYMFDAEGYVNGEASEYRATIDDALKNGGFKMIKKEYNDTIWAEDFSSEALNRTRTVKEIKKIYETEKVLDANGVPLRYPHDITENNLIISQVIVEQVNLERKFREKLEQQRDIAANKSIEADKVEQARIAQQRIVAEGERDKAAERVTQEKDQITKLIAIETKVKEEESKRQLAKIALETSKLDAQRRKVDADAKRYELQQADGLSEEMKYRIDADVRRDIGVAKAVAGPQGLTLPSIMMGSGGSGSNSSPVDALIAQMLLNQKK